MQAFSIGNDLVDSATFSTKDNRRFADRVLSAQEHLQIKADWSLLPLYWAAKEAAFKALKRLNTKLIFSPAQFIFDHWSGLVNFENQEVSCMVVQQTAQLAVYAKTQPLPTGFSEFHWFSDVQTEQKYCFCPDSQVSISESQAVRILTIRKVAQLFGIAVADIQVQPDWIACKQSQKGQAPLLLINGQEFPALLSFSHDAGYVYSCLVVLK